MPTKDRVEAFIAEVERGEYVGTIEKFYVENASMQENRDAPRVGRAALMENERGVLAMFEEVRARCVRPFFVNGDYVVIRWTFEFRGADGIVLRLDELAHQRWQDAQIVEEQFFYDPAQMRG